MTSDDTTTDTPTPPVELPEEHQAALGDPPEFTDERDVREHLEDMGYI